MPVISIRIEEKLNVQLEQLAKENKELISVLIRRLLKEALAVDAYKKQDAETRDSEAIKRKEQLDAEYKRNLDFMIMENAVLLRLIVKKSGKFTDEEANSLLTTSQRHVETYMEHYKNCGEK